MKLAVAALLGIGLLALMAVPAAFANSTGTASGFINYYNVSSGSCTSTAWSGSTQSDGGSLSQGFFDNNVGSPPIYPVVGTSGSQICLDIELTGSGLNTGDYYTFTFPSNKLTGSITITIGTSPSCGTNCYEAEGVFTSAYSSACTTAPLKISSTNDANYETTFGLQMDSQVQHIWVGTGTCIQSAPEFPFGILAVFAVAIPGMLLLRGKYLPKA